MDNSNGNARSSRGRAADSREPSRAASELFGDAGNTARISARRGPRGKHSHAPPSSAPAGATPPLADTAPLTAGAADWRAGRAATT